MVEGRHTVLIDQQWVTIAHSIGGVGPLCTLVVARAKTVGESGDRAGCKACTLYVEVSGRFGCWMTLSKNEKSARGQCQSCGSRIWSVEVPMTKTYHIAKFTTMVVDYQVSTWSIQVERKSSGSHFGILK